MTLKEMAELCQVYVLTLSGVFPLALCFLCAADCVQRSQFMFKLRPKSNSRLQKHCLCSVNECWPKQDGWVEYDSDEQECTEKMKAGGQRMLCS